ncbi:MAG: hypothetical protein ACK46X_16835 [Candidatus Sericytochromatia bacterium]
MLDIRTPIGLMFIIIGILIGAYGLMTDARTYQISLGHNINLIWGLVMLVVGGALFMSEKVKADTPGTDTDTPGVKWPPKDEQQP